MVSPLIFPRLHTFFKKTEKKNTFSNLFDNANIIFITKQGKIHVIKSTTLLMNTDAKILNKILADEI